MPAILIIIGAAILAAVIVVLIIWRVRSHRFHPDPDKLRQQRELNADLKETGFAYEIKGAYRTVERPVWNHDRRRNRSI